MSYFTLKLEFVQTLGDPEVNSSQHHCHLCGKRLQDVNFECMITELDLYWAALTEPEIMYSDKQGNLHWTGTQGRG